MLFIYLHSTSRNKVNKVLIRKSVKIMQKIFFSALCHNKVISGFSTCRADLDHVFKEPIVPAESEH